MYAPMVSLVFGGNFLHSFNIEGQGRIRIAAEPTGVNGTTHRRHGLVTELTGATSALDCGDEAAPDCGDKAALDCGDSKLSPSDDRSTLRFGVVVVVVDVCS